MNQRSKSFVSVQGDDYSADQLEFLKAIDAFRRRNGRSPADWETLGILTGLGYRKEAAEVKGASCLSPSTS